MPKTDPAKPWADRLRFAEARRKEWAEQFQVQKGRAYFEGRQNPGVSRDEWITINKIYSHIQAQLPMLYSIDPYFYVKLKRSFSPNPMDIALYEQRAKIRQAYLNYLKTSLGLKIKARLAIQDAEFAFGVIKVYYQADQAKNPDAGAALQSEAGEPLVGDDGAALLEPDTIPVNEKYCLTRVHPDDLLFGSDDGTLPDKWTFLAERVRTTPEEAKRDKSLKRAVLSKLATQSRREDNERRGRSTLQDEGSGDEIYVWYEIYDLKRGQWLKASEDGEVLMDPKPLPPGMACDPYAILRFTLRDDSPYPIPPVSQALDPQRELNESRSKVLTHRKRFNRKYEVFEQGLVDESEISKLESGDDGTVIRKQTPARVVDPIADAPLDQQTYLELGYLANDITEMFGATPEAIGLAKSESATQAGILDARLQVKEGDKLSAVVDWITEIARKLDHLVQTHITRDEAIKVTGPQGEFWELVRATDYETIQGEYEYSINAGASTPRLPQVERAQWLAFLNVVAGFPQLLTSKRFLQKMAQMHSIEDEQMVDELYALGQQIMGGSMPAPGQSGSQAGVGESRPLAQLLGAAMGGSA